MNIVSILALACLVSASAFASPCNTSTPTCEGRFEASTGRFIGYTSTFALDSDNPDVTNAVIMIHAADRVVAWGFDRMNKMIAAGELSPNTLVVSPLFLADLDKPSAGMLYWGANEWSGGFDSLDGSHTSSFAALDTLMRKILGSKHFPNLSTVTVTGLSAGGQFTQRYALGTTIVQEYPALDFRFIVAAPSSYVYPTADRWLGDHFGVPANPGCAYNDFRYGLNNPSAYMARISAPALVSQFTSRELVFMSGELDDATAAPNPPNPHNVKDGVDLDVSCEAEWQGSSRLERSRIFSQYLAAEFPQMKQQWLSIPGVAHSYAVYEDPRIITILQAP